MFMALLVKVGDLVKHISPQMYNGTNKKEVYFSLT